MTLKKIGKKYNALNSIIRKKNTKKKNGKIFSWKIAVKDNINVKNTLTTAGCKLLLNFKSVFNAHIIDKLYNEGGKIVAKTSMDELAMGGKSYCSLKKKYILNPHDITRIAGGSSGGSAILVSKGLVRSAIGTDTGDSVIKPASFCGIVGVKPTYGRISRYGIIPYAHSLDHVGYFVNNVKDAAIMLEVLAGFDFRDMTSSKKKVENYSNYLNINLKKKKIGFLNNIHKKIDNKFILKKLKIFEKKLNDEGIKIIKKTFNEKLFNIIPDIYTIISNSEAVFNHLNLNGICFGLFKKNNSYSFKKNIIITRTNGFSYDIKKRLLYGAFSLLYNKNYDILNKTKKIRKILINYYEDFFKDIDILVTLVTEKIAPKINDNIKFYNNHIIINNLSGNPSISIPFCYYKKMPISILISAKKFNEKLMFSFAKKIEKILNLRK